MRDKKILMLVISALLAVFLMGFISAVCCEKTLSSASCQNVPDENLCDSEFRLDPTSCESTTYCSTGTCVDRSSGTCLPSPQSTCDPTLGGFWYDKPEEEVAECQIGCCLLGEGAALVERIRCDAMGSDYGVTPNFRADIQNDLECVALASPLLKGACVTETSTGRDCAPLTKGECQTAAGDFHEGFLCTAPELGTACAMTKQTTCIEGRNEVYFVDSCSNIANVYDASKVEDIEYWTYTKDASNPEEACGVGQSNKNSQTCGNCNYLLGSTCSSGSAQYGNYICKDLGCTEGEYAQKFKNTYGKYPEHGEEWCSEPMENFENALPGQLSYRLYCYNGEVQWDLCGHSREGLCLKDESIGVARCVPNRWQDCFAQNNSESCNNNEARDCKVIEGIDKRDASMKNIPFTDEDDEEIEATCVPKYSPSINFWDEEEDMECSFATTFCAAIYTKRIGGKWRGWELESYEKYKNNFDKLYDKGERSRCFQWTGGDDKLPKEVKLKEDWATGIQNMCTAFGDCGVKSNYLNYEGYNIWERLFIGNYTEESLPG